MGIHLKQKNSIRVLIQQYHRPGPGLYGYRLRGKYLIDCGTAERADETIEKIKQAVLETVEKEINK